MPSPRTIAVPSTRSSAAVLSARRRLVVLLLAAVIVLGVLGPVISWRMSNKPVPAPPPSVPPRLAAVAEQAGRDFLAGRNSTVPAAKGVDTDFSGDPTPVLAAGETMDAETSAALINGVSKLAVSSFAVQGESVSWLGDAHNQLVHTIRFRVVINAAPYLLSVPVLDDPTFGTVLAGTPALLPATTGERDVPAADYTQNYAAVETSVDQKVEDSVNAWIAAYTAGANAPKELLGVTRDQTGRTYSGLGEGWTGQLEQIVSAVPVGGADTGKPAGLIVQARVALSGPAANGFALSTTYDLYVVTEGDPAQPPVVAWGPAGSAESLTPYENAN